MKIQTTCVDVGPCPYPTRPKVSAALMRKAEMFFGRAEK